MELRNFEELRDRLGSVPKHTVSVACAHEENTLKALYTCADAVMVGIIHCYFVVGC